MGADRRIAALRLRLADERVGAMLVCGSSNIRYLTGFDGVLDSSANAACLVTAEYARFYTDFRYGEAAEAAAQGGPWSVHVIADGIYQRLCDDLRAEGVDLVAIESSVPYGRFKFVSERHGGSLTAVDGWVEELRQIKEPREIERISAAAELTDRAFEHILEHARPGAVERDIALELECFMRRHGAEDVAFEPIVASGPNSARPHARAGDRTLRRGDLLKLDFGAKVDGYCADLTRTVVLGPASDRQREVYEAVLAANTSAIAGLRPGVPARDVDAIARDLLSERGFGERFGHGLGHGVGLDVHELPALSPRSGDSVRSGSVTTIEPGVYLEGFGGVRIEDLAVVEEDGCRLLSHAPKDLMEL